MSETGKGAASTGLLTALISKPAKAASGLGADMSEDEKSEGPATPYGSAPGEMPESKYGDHSFKAVAKAFGIPSERMGSAQAALKQYVRECIAAHETEEADDEG